MFRHSRWMVRVVLISAVFLPTSPLGASEKPGQEAPRKVSKDGSEALEAQPAAAGAWQCRVVFLKHARVNDVAETVGALFHRETGRRITGFETGNAVVLRGPAEEVAEMAGLIAQLDVPQPEAKEAPPPEPSLRIIPVRHAKASDLAKLIDTLALAPSGRGRRGSGNEPPVRWAVDERTNVIALLAGDAQIARAMELAKALDVPLEQPKPKVGKQGD